jgi:hypothetical protein
MVLVDHARENARTPYRPLPPMWWNAAAAAGVRCTSSASLFDVRER